MSSYLSHDMLIRRFRIRGTIRTDTRIHIGSGEEGMVFGDADTFQIKIYKNGISLPYIPGSSLKGIFRSSAEGILKAIKKKVCLLEKDSNCFNIGREVGRLAKSNDKEKIIKKLNEFCFGCKIFGGHGYASHIFFSESYPRDITSVSYDISPGIAINRRDGTTMERALFSFEHINPMSEFSFEVKVINLPNFLFGLIIKIIYLINKGVILIGGKKRAGLGKVTIILDNVIFEQFQTNNSRQEDENQKVILDLATIDRVSQDEITISKLSELGLNDFNIDISLSDLKNKNKEDFSENLIKNLMEVWNQYVTYS